MSGLMADHGLVLTAATNTVRTAAGSMYVTAVLMMGFAIDAARSTTVTSCKARARAAATPS